MLRKMLASFSLLIGLVISSTTQGDEKLKDIACRSVHLNYPAGEGVAFYNEVIVKKSAEGTYFCVCGFDKGYYGIQELANGKKLLIFSVWDPGTQNDPSKVKEEVRVKMLHKHDDVRIGRFGNEGTGGQSFYDYDWKLNETYRFLVKAKSDGENRTAFSGYFYHPEKKEWLHLITFSTVAKGKVNGYYSFIEDFRRNKISATKTREATFGNGWVQSEKGDWTPLLKARFTGDSNPALNINSKVIEDRFLLATGGDIQNDDVKLKETMSRPPTGLKLPE